MGDLDIHRVKETMVQLQSKNFRMEEEKAKGSAEYAAVLASEQGLTEMHEKAVTIMNDGILQALEGVVNTTSTIFEAKTRRAEQVRGGISTLAMLWRTLAQERKRNIMRWLVRRHRCAVLGINRMARSISSQLWNMLMKTIETMVHAPPFHCYCI